MTSYNATVVVRTNASADDLVDQLAGHGHSSAVSTAPPPFVGDLEVVLTVQGGHLTEAIGVAVRLLTDRGCEPRWVTASTTEDYDAWLDATG